ncbi:type VI secretion system contractile sheath large subunit [Legionella yabuuchiae]|uniref:type VI secretion system contractile sheath large subunit n=1 Tax=Legionella yabuuchiae TaxID=376727 RepID=UPI001054E738|nr:type VI secretion system contractile sheath large subunit [Legionella yabuuchiae]
METNLQQSQGTSVLSSYQQLCHIAEVEPFTESLDLTHFTRAEQLANKQFNERLAASLQVFLSMAVEQGTLIERVDKVLLDQYISKIDEMLSAQLDEILHHTTFQELESLWMSLKHVVDRTDFTANIKIELLDVDKQALIEDFEDVSDTSQSGLYKQVYEREYDTPGGEPFTAMISPYEFDASAIDLSLLRQISKVAAVAHCPFIGSVGGSFFNKSSLQDVIEIEDLVGYMDRAEYIRWNSFRDSEDARYIGLTLPRFLLRLPYGENNPVKRFQYNESVTSSADQYLWGRASFAFAANLGESFRKYGWCVNIRGPESGGKVDHLPLHQYNLGQGLQTKIPCEVMIPETRELTFANLGFIPLSYYKNSDYACFFSANSAQKPMSYLDKQASSNSRINARLPYIFLSARIAHYLKVMQRENIGSSLSRSEQEEQLNQWLKTLITKMNNPGPELAATHPLRDGQVMVEELPEHPGYYRINLYAVPHFQVEGMDVKLSVVGQIPTANDS